MIKPFNNSQLERISEITSNLGLIFFASIVVPFFGNKSYNSIDMFLGFICSLFFWIASLIIIKEIKNDST